MVLRPWAVVTFWALLLAVTGKWTDMVLGGPLQVPLMVARSRSWGMRSGARLAIP